MLELNSYMSLFHRVIVTLTYCELGLPVVLHDFMVLNSVASRIVHYLLYSFLFFNFNRTEWKTIHEIISLARGQGE